MISKSGKPIWRLLHQSGQKTARETKAVIWEWNGEDGCPRLGADLFYLVFGG